MLILEIFALEDLSGASSMEPEDTEEDEEHEEEDSDEEGSDASQDLDLQPQMHSLKNLS